MLIHTTAQQHSNTQTCKSPYEQCSQPQREKNLLLITIPACLRRYNPPPSATPVCSSSSSSRLV
jgi:hypothetical protein